MLTLHPFQFLKFKCYGMHEYTVRFAKCSKAFFMLLSYDGEKIKCCLAYAYTKWVNAVYVTQLSTCTDVLQQFYNGEVCHLKEILYTS